MLGPGECRVESKQPVSGFLAFHEGLGIGAQIGHVHFRQTVLSGSEKITRTSEPKIFFGNPETITGFTHNLHARFGLFAFGVCYKNAVAFMLPASNASTQLMELAEPETIGVLHQHESGVGDIHADFDYGRGNQRAAFSRPLSWKALRLRLPPPWDRRQRPAAPLRRVFE